MYSMCHCWSRTPQEEGEWIKHYQSQKRTWNSKPEATRSMRSKQLLTARYTANRQMTKWQASTTSFCGRVTQKKKTPGSLHWQSYTSGSWLAPFIRSIRRSRQQPLHIWTPLHQRPGQRFPNKSQNKNVIVQAKEPISGAESRSPSGVALCGSRRRCCAQVFDTISRPYPQSINHYPVFLSVFLARFWKFFTCRQFQPYTSVFLLVFSSSLGGFWLLKSPGFPSHFLIEFSRFFYQLNTHGFLLSLPLGLGGFFLLSNKAMISNAYIRSSELASKKEGNCNVIKSSDQSQDGSNLIEKISDHYGSRIVRLT